MKNYTLKEFRLKQNKTRVEVAKKSEITTQYLDFIEKGQRVPSDAVKKKLAKALNCKPIDIFLCIETTQSRINK